MVMICKTGRVEGDDKESDSIVFFRVTAQKVWTRTSSGGGKGRRCYNSAAPAVKDPCGTFVADEYLCGNLSSDERLRIRFLTVQFKEFRLSLLLFIKASVHRLNLNALFQSCRLPHTHSATALRLNRYNFCVVVSVEQWGTCFS